MQLSNHARHHAAKTLTPQSEEPYAAADRDAEHRLKKITFRVDGAVCLQLTDCSIRKLSIV